MAYLPVAWVRHSKGKLNAALDNATGHVFKSQRAKEMWVYGH